MEKVSLGGKYTLLKKVQWKGKLSGKFINAYFLEGLLCKNISNEQVRNYTYALF